jgi:nitrous oxidase accessory protein NosD
MEAEAATLFPVVSGDQVNDIVIEGLAIDGNRAANENLNGNYGGGIFLQDCDRVTIRDVTTRDNNGDGISWQVCDDVTVDACRSLNNADLGLHPGSGSQRPVVTNCVIRGCDQGFFFCWGVRHGRVEGNLIEDSGKYGISIGHRDTDNLVRGNTVRRSGQHGILFREHPVARRDPHRNIFEDNLIEDSGAEGDCVAIEMLGTAGDVVLRGNRIVDTREASDERRRIGIRVGGGVERLTVEGGEYRGIEEEVVNLREG